MTFSGKREWSEKNGMKEDLRVKRRSLREKEKKKEEYSLLTSNFSTMDSSKSHLGKDK